MPTEIQMNRILFATDFLESSRLALDYAVALATHFHATIIMLHVVELSSAAQDAEIRTSLPSLTRKFSQQRLEALANGVRRLGISIEVIVEAGLPSSVILQSCSVHSADLLVLGIHGVHRGLEHLLIGSNTERILLSANCPTLTVGAHVLSGVDLGLQLNEILYFSDLTPEATAAAPYAIFFSNQFSAPIDVCISIPPVAKGNALLTSQLAEAYSDSMKQVLQNSYPEWSTAAFQLEHGMEIDQIVERAQSEHAGLIVLGVHTESHLGRHLHISFAYHLLANATCPVLTVRHVSATSPSQA
jgi:nucleotide-binding universal stress UspA family protein